ncbi:MAG: ion transporter [Prevotellaceae bacterium]|nr:ion transporter [Candidatus Minthosoma equi]
MKNIRRKIFLTVEYGNFLGTISKFYDNFMLVVIFASLVPLAFRYNSPVFDFIEYFSVVMFIIDYILRWITADFRIKGLRYRWMAFIIYPFTIWAIIDLLSILPIVSTLHLGDYYRVLRVLRFFKILRVLRAIRYFRPYVIMMKVFQKEAHSLLAVFVFAISYILVVALVMFNVDYHDHLGGDGYYLFENFFEAVYWSTCTLTTVGYGDIYPITTLGRVISMVSSVVGVAIVAMPSGIIIRGYMDVVNEEDRKKRHKKTTQA